jgi:hypothetical protein
VGVFHNKFYPLASELALTLANAQIDGEASKWQAYRSAEHPSGTAWTAKQLITTKCLNM